VQGAAKVGGPLLFAMLVFRRKYFFAPDEFRVCFGSILLQKSAAADGRSVISFGAAGFDPPALTPSTQLQLYAMHRTGAGGGRATRVASRRRF
jgi:hypothetical protein